MNTKKRVFIKIKSVFRKNNFIQRKFYLGHCFFNKKKSAGFISSYILISLAVSAGLLGGFFLGRTNLSDKNNIPHSKSDIPHDITTVSSSHHKVQSLLGSVSEVFSRTLGKNPEHVVAEINLDNHSTSSFVFEPEKSATTTELFSATTSSKNKTVKKVSEKVSECSSFSNIASSRDVLINELAWMGSMVQNGESSSDASRREWIEFFNVSSRTISLTNWQLRDQAGKFKIIFPSGASLRPHSFYLLARGVAEKVLGKKPDLLYSAGLSNDGALLRLINNRCEIVDQIDASVKWPAGNRETKQTLERNADGLGWHTSVSPGGTPRAENSVIKTTTAPSPSGGGSGSVAPSPGSSSSSTLIIYPKILINEIQTASASSTHEEFVELYNPSNEAVDLTNWYIQKKTKSASSFSTFLPKTALAGKSIAAHGFFVISHPSSSLIAQVVTDEGLADHNTLVLKNPHGDIIDKVGWGGAGDFEEQAAPNPDSDQSIQRKVSGSSFIDTEHNSEDFEIKDCPSPQSFVGACSELALLLSTNSESGTATNTSAVVLASSSSGVSSSSATTTSSSSSISTSLSTLEENTVTPTSTETAVVSSTTTSSSTALTSSTPTILFSSPNHLVIIEVQITGGSGKTDNDYIRIFNPTSNGIDVGGWKLRKRTQSGTESSIKVFPDSVSVSLGGNFLWANSKDGFSEIVSADVSSTQTLASNNSIVLLNASDVVIDAVAWGSDHVGPFIEGIAFPNSAPVFHRKVSEGVVVDTDQNQADFEAISH
ncbi:MAG: lamin tail domain-containing protein [Patescibacteria group bacterium]